MSIAGLIVLLIALGVVLWLINSYVPMDGKIKQILNITIVIIAILVVLYAFGLLDFARSTRVPKL